MGQLVFLTLRTAFTGSGQVVPERIDTAEGFIESTQYGLDACFGC